MMSHAVLTMTGGALILVIVGLWGMIATRYHIKFLLRMIYLFLLAMIALEVATAVVTGASPQIILNPVGTWIKNSINDTSDKNSRRTDLESVRDNLSCCGWNSYKDWFLSVNVTTITNLYEIPTAAVAAISVTAPSPSIARTPIFKGLNVDPNNPP